MYILKKFKYFEDMRRYEQHLLNLFFESPLCINLSANATGLTSFKAKEIRSTHNNCNSPEVVKKRRTKQLIWHKQNKSKFIDSNLNNKKVTIYAVTEPNGNVRIVRGNRNLKFIYPELISDGNISGCINGKLRSYKNYKIRKIRDTSF